MKTNIVINLSKVGGKDNSQVRNMNIFSGLNRKGFIELKDDLVKQQATYIDGGLYDDDPVPFIKKLIDVTSSGSDTIIIDHFLNNINWMYVQGIVDYMKSQLKNVVFICWCNNEETIYTIAKVYQEDMWFARFEFKDRFTPRFVQYPDWNDIVFAYNKHIKFI